MAIKQITKAPEVRKFVVYDLEWWPKSMDLRMVGLYDGETFRHWETVGGFLEHVLTDAYQNVWMFAHWGGAADIAFFLRYLYKRNYVVDLRFSGSSAVFCEVRKGKKKWIFVDSFFLLRAPLATIMRKLGMEKGGATLCAVCSLLPKPQKNCHDCEKASDAHHWSILNGGFKQLVEYNTNDCIGLYVALERFQETLLSMGTDIMPTIAATAMRLFRRVYLKTDIRTDAENNFLTRQAYIASRVEVFSKWSEDCYQYDINSSFPSSMTLDAPGEYIGKRRSVPDEHDLFLVKAKVTAPDDSYFPPLPYRHAGKIWFPHGTWESWFTGADFRLMEELGRIEQVFEVREFQPCNDMRGYVEDVYARRKATKDEYEREIWKLLMNALYGKFAERTEKDTIILNSGHDPAYYLSKGATTAEEIFGGAIVLTTDRAIAHEHVPFSAQTTSRSREKLLRLMLIAEDVKYTDSVTGDRTVVVQNPRGETEILPVEDLWARRRVVGIHVVVRDDGKEVATMEGWRALASDGVREGWFPLTGLVRHQAGKRTWRISDEAEGETEVTADHGIMVNGEAVSPVHFLSRGLSFHKVRAVPSRKLPGPGEDVIRRTRACLRGRVMPLPPSFFDLTDEDFKTFWGRSKLVFARSQAVVAGLSYMLDQRDIAHVLRRRSDEWEIDLKASLPTRRWRSREAKPGEYVYDLCVEGAHTFVDGVGRVLLHNTDSLTTPSILAVGPELGELKLEKRIKRGHYRAPKLYCTEDDEGDVKIKAKGFSKVFDRELDRGRKLTEDDFQALCDGGFVEQERMRRPKEMLRKVAKERAAGEESLMPQLMMIQKRLQSPVEKRAFSPDGKFSRAYTIEEIHAAHPK